MTTDDLSSLFGKPQPGVRFRQGTVLTWDGNTGENTIDLAGGLLTNVPVLNTSEATALKAGHVVGLLGQGKSWFIIGRVTPPNSADFAGASVAFGRVHTAVTNFGLTPTDTEKLTATIDVPAWADEALAQMSCVISMANGQATGHYVLFTPYIDGVDGNGQAFGIGPSGDSSFNDQAGSSVSHSRLITNPGPTIEFSIEGGTGGTTVNANGANLLTIDAFAVFRSTV